MDLVSTIGYVWLFSGVITFYAGLWLIANVWTKKSLNKLLMVTFIICFIMFLGLGDFI